MSSCQRFQLEIRGLPPPPGPLSALLLPAEEATEGAWLSGSLLHSRAIGLGGPPSSRVPWWRLSELCVVHGCGPKGPEPRHGLPVKLGGPCRRPPGPRERGAHRLGIDPKTPGWDAHALSHQPIRGSGAHPGRGKDQRERERGLFLLKGIAEGTYNTKHAEAAKPYYTTRYPHTHTQTKTQTCTCLYGGRHNRLRDHDIAPAASKFKTFRREVP